MTDFLYFDMAMEDKAKHREFKAYGKLERDFRDAALFPEVKKKLKDIHAAWKELLRAYEKLDID